MTLIFPYIGNNHPNWLIFFKWVETTNQASYTTWSFGICLKYSVGEAFKCSFIVLILLSRPKIFLYIGRAEREKLLMFSWFVIAGICRCSCTVWHYSYAGVDRTWTFETILSQKHIFENTAFYLLQDSHKIQYVYINLYVGMICIYNYIYIYRHITYT